MSDPVRIIVGEGASAQIEVPDYVIIAGRDGPRGPQGEKGENGKSAYEVAVDNGFVGTPEEWLESLKGETGKSAYESAVDGGYTGTEAEFNAELADIEAAAQTASTAAEAAVAAQEAAEDAQDAAETAVTHYPKIEDGTWHVWDAATGTYVDTEINATGPQGPVGPGLPAGGTDGDVLVKNGVADYSARWEKPQYSRPNLLDNWYFVGGGSQSGDGVFPINQRGQTTYVNQGPCIDRWRLRDSNNGSVAIAPAGDGVVITINDNSGTGTTFKSLDQILDKNLLLGKRVTLSCIISEYANTGVQRLQLGIWAADNVNYHSLSVGLVEITGPGLYQVTINIPSETSYTYLKYAIVMANTTGVHGTASVKVKAVKLEVGTYQTLAHNEGTVESPNWVLNELPDYGEELAKCQRWFQRIHAPDILTKIGTATMFRTGRFNVVIPLMRPMAKTGASGFTVTVNNIGPVIITGDNAYSVHYFVAAPASERLSETTVCFNISDQASYSGTFTPYPGNVVSDSATGGGYVDISCES